MDGWVFQARQIESPNLAPNSPHGVQSDFINGDRPIRFFFAPERFAVLAFLSERRES